VAVVGGSVPFAEHGDDATRTGAGDTDGAGDGVDLLDEMEAADSDCISVASGQL